MYSKSTDARHDRHQPKNSPGEQAELAYRHTSFTKAFGRQRSFIGRSARVNYVNSRFGDCRQVVPRLGNAGSC